MCRHLKHSLVIMAVVSQQGRRKWCYATTKPVERRRMREVERTIYSDVASSFNQYHGLSITLNKYYLLPNFTKP